MKRLVVITLAGLLLAGGALAEQRETRIEVAGMTCPSCPYIAAQAIQSVESAAVVAGEYDPQAQLAVFTVSYDDAVTTPEAIAAAPAQYGYSGRVVEGADSGS